MHLFVQQARQRIFWISLNLSLSHLGLFGPKIKESCLLSLPGVLKCARGLWGTLCQLII